MNDNEIWIGKKTIANKLGISINTLNKYIKDGFPVKNFADSSIAIQEELKDFVKKLKNNPVKRK